jgi:Zn-dependent alcohol dehydrogenase
VDGLDKKSVLVTVASTAIAVIVTGVIGYASGVWNQGSAAMQEDEIERIVEEVLDRELQTDSGMTQREALAQINNAVGRIESTVNINREDIRDIRNAVRALAAD